jgi:hypothetical protein
MLTESRTLDSRTAALGKLSTSESYPALQSKRHSIYATAVVACPHLGFVEREVGALVRDGYVHAVEAHMAEQGHPRRRLRPPLPAAAALLARRAAGSPARQRAAPGFGGRTGRSLRLRAGLRML